MICAQCCQCRGTDWQVIGNVYYRICPACALFIAQWLQEHGED